MSPIIAPRHPAKTPFPHTDLLGIDHLSADEIAAVLDLAEYYVVQNRRRSQKGVLLKGLVMVNLFLENSTRTRLSFEMAAKRLGCDVLNMGEEGSSIKKGESLTDTLKTINAMIPDVLIIRHGAEGSAHEAADIMDCPVLNAGDGTREHPTQALLDALTLKRHFGKLEGLTVTICSDFKRSRVAHSDMLLFEKMGVRVKCVGPRQFLPENAGNATTSFEEGLKDADAIITQRIQKERFQENLTMSDADYFRDFGLTPERLKHAKPHAVVLNPGPMTRGVEIDAAIADDPARSLITTQVEMGVAVRMACLDLLTRNIRR